MHSDRGLIARLQKGSRDALRAIFDRYQNKLLFYCVAIVKSEGTAKDIVQETFIRLWTNRETLDPDQSLSGFLHTITRNLALNHLKRAGYDKDLKNQLWQNIQDAHIYVEFEENLHAQESRRLVQQAVDQLPPRRRLIFKLSRDEGNTHETIAQKLGISKNTVKNHMVSTLKDIRKYLNRHSDIALCWLPILLYEVL